MKKSEILKIINEEIDLTIIPESADQSHRLTEGENAARWFDNLKYYYQKGLRSPDLRDPAEKKAYTKLAKQFFSKLKEGLHEMKMVNKETGKDITKHVLAYMEKKITKKEFEKLTGLSKEKVKVTEISKEEKAAQFKLKLFLKKGLRLSVKDGEDKLYKYAMELEDLADDEYDEVVSPLFAALELVQDAGVPGVNNVEDDKEYRSYIKSADKHMKTFIKNAKKVIGSMKEGVLESVNEAFITQIQFDKMKPGQVIKVGKEIWTKMGKPKEHWVEKKSGIINEPNNMFRHFKNSYFKKKKVTVEGKLNEAISPKKAAEVLFDKLAAAKLIGKQNRRRAVGVIEYMLSRMNFNESVNEAKVPYNFSEDELKRVLKLLGRSASTEVKMIKAFEKAFGRKLTRDELFEGKLTEAFKKGDKVKYLGHPGIITNVSDYNGKTYYSVAYNKGTGKTKAKGILSTDGSITEGKLNEMDINDPILVAIRARKTDLKKKASLPKVKKISTKQYYKLMDAEIDLIDQMKDAAKDYERLDSEMNQDAGQKGDAWTDADANRYGGDLNKLQTKIEKLAKQKLAVKKQIMNYRIN